MSDKARYAADWTSVGPQRRVVIPNAIAIQLPWLSGEVIEPLSLQLAEEGSVIIRPDAAVEDLLKAAREALREEYGQLEGARRIAFTYHLFRHVPYESRARRLKLRPAILKHMAASEGDDLFCLVYGEQLELIGSAQYTRLFGELSQDVSVG